MKATIQSQSFDEWFAKEYDRIKERLSLSGAFDEDAFHDTYISLKEQACQPYFIMGDLTEAFKREYRRISKRNISEAFAYCNPDERFFTLLADSDTDGTETADRAAKRQELAHDISRHVRESYSQTVVLLFNTHILQGASMTDTMAITGWGYKRCKSTLAAMTSDIRHQTIIQSRNLNTYRYEFEHFSQAKAVR